MKKELYGYIKSFLNGMNYNYEEVSNMYLGGGLTLKAGFEVYFLDGTKIYIEVTNSGIRLWKGTTYLYALYGDIWDIDEQLMWELETLNKEHNIIDLQDE